jgi:hypothetical protein
MLFVLLLVSGLAVAQTVPEPKPLTEVQKLRMENLKLRYSVLQSRMEQVQVQAQQIQTLFQQEVEKLRTEQGLPASYVFDTETLGFKAPMTTPVSAPKPPAQR